VRRLKGTLRVWLQQLLRGPYDEAYVLARWRVGYRHVEIGLPQVYTNAAMSRLRRGLIQAAQQRWTGPSDELQHAIRSLNTLMDLDLAVIEDAYQSESNARLEAAERLATLGQVAGGVAHELRNPLNVIRTSIFYLLNARRPTPEKTEEHLRRIERHVTRADGVIAALSSFARMPLPALRPVAPEGLIREAIEAEEPGPEVRVELELPETLPLVLVDPDQLRIALGNLIRNACDAMPQGGVLRIRGAARGGLVELAVSDTGVGIAPEDLTRIMEPLYSTKARGLGLGLSIARSIVEKNQGSLRVTSELGVGSTITLELTAAAVDRAGGPG
jgi:signal transduction histidine kinase